MAIKKTIVTTTSFLISAILLSRVYLYQDVSSSSQNINFHALENLSRNIQELTKNPGEMPLSKESSMVTSDIIKLIDKEITQKIKLSRYTIKKPNVPVSAVATKTAVKTLAKTQVTAAVIPYLSKDLSHYEINNSGLIHLSALTGEKINTIKFESIKLAENYNEIVKDEVVVAQASTSNPALQADEISTAQRAPLREIELENYYKEEAIAEGEEAKAEASDEASSETKESDMVMFDYSQKQENSVVGKTIDQKLYERPISSTVKNAITREIGSAPIKKLLAMNTQVPTKGLTKIDDQEIDLNAEANTSYEYSSEQNVTSKAIEAFRAPEPVAEARFILKAKEINLSSQKKRQAHSFEFVPDYERAERSDDQGSGEIAFGYSLSGEMNTQTGVIQAQGMISTRVELNLSGKAILEVPLLNEEGMQKFLQNKGLAIEGNLILIALDSSIIDTDVDSTFGEKLFFDKNFKSIPSIKGASFVMFAGVKSGNIMIRYLLSNKEIAQKIVYVGEGEMYFEDPEFIETKRETYNFTTRNLLGQKRKELIINGEAIAYFNTSNNAKKKALNAYDIKIPTLTAGMRKYFEFKHLKDSVFVGTSSEKEIEIPGNDFIAKVLEMSQISNIKDRCVVQVNLTKDLREIKTNGKNRSGEMLVETSFLDKDGNFSNESEMAEKAFVVGDQEGQFNIRLDYTDGSTEFLKTFCSEGSYLVEQL